MKRFAPVLTQRTPASSYFPELTMAYGPQTIGHDQPQSFDNLYGRAWSLVLANGNNTPYLYQKLAGQDDWALVTRDVPPLFDGRAPDGTRRWSLAFDQSARPCVAYELNGQVVVMRWDTTVGQYVTDITFPGADPHLIIDASFMYFIPDSDILLFYLSPDRTKVMCRIQREVYQVEYEIHDLGQPVILDQAVALTLRYELLLSDASGNPLGNMLISDPYPYRVEDKLGIKVAPVDAARFHMVFKQEVQDDLSISVAPLNRPRLSTPVSEPTGDANDAFVPDTEVFLPGGPPGGNLFGAMPGTLGDPCVLEPIGRPAPTVVVGSPPILDPSGTVSPKTDAGFTAVLGPIDAHDINLYGVTGAHITFDLFWLAPHEQFMPRKDENNNCVVDVEWVPQDRTVQARIGISATPDVGDVFAWSAYGNVEAQAAIIGSSQLRTHTVTTSLLFQIPPPGVPLFVFAEIRNPASTTARDNTFVFYSGNGTIRFVPLTSKSQRQTITQELQDDLTIQVAPVDLNLISTTLRQELQDDLFIIVEPTDVRKEFSTAQFVLQDDLWIRVKPVSVELRRTS